jgi:hypothetical protein
MEKLSPRQVSGLIGGALTLLALGMCSLLHAAPVRELWHDEAFGILASVRGVSWTDLWLRGAPGQGSPHPLYYVLEKALLGLWGEAPQRYWQFAFYFRLTPVFFYAAGGALVLAFTPRLLAVVFPRAPFWQRAAIGAALGVFHLRIQFAEYYALEARPYSMWLFLSTAHLLLTLRLLPAGFETARQRRNYAALSALLAMVASPGIFQIGLSFVAIAWPKRLLRDSWVLVPSGLISVLYLHSVGVNGYNTGDVFWYLECLKEVAYKSFHARNGFVFFPVFAVGAWRIVARASCRWRLAFYLGGLIALSAFLYAMCLWKGFLLASRQYIYLLPAFEVVYFFALWGAGELLDLASFRGRRLGASGWLVVWSLFICAGSLREFAQRAATLPAALARDHVYGRVDTEICGRPMSSPGFGETQFAEMDRACHPAAAR